MRVSIQEAAKTLGVTEQFLRISLQNDKFPFGTAVKLSNRWTYFICRNRLERYIKGELNV